MARHAHYASPPIEEGITNPLTPDAVTKMEFGRRLAKMMIDRGWRQSDLMREVNRLREGDEPEMGRDAISKYVNGRYFPTPVSLNMLCRALGVSRDELLPNASMRAINDEHPAVELKVAANQPGRAWLRVNRLMRFETAAQIVSIINEEDKRDLEEK